MNKKLIIFCLMLAVAAMSIPAYATEPPTVIGDWENSNDSWGAWVSNKVQPATNFTYSTTEGVKLNNYSLDVNQSGWAQALASDLSTAQRAAFMASSTFSIDMSVAATPGITAGYTQIYALYMNAPGPGWTTVASGNPVNFDWWDGRPDETKTLTVDYSTFRNAITPNPPGWVQIIFALNTGGGAPPEMYFDNAKLSGIPEPATIALLSLGGLALLRRKRT